MAEASLGPFLSEALLELRELFSVVLRMEPVMVVTEKPFSIAVRRKPLLFSSMEKLFSFSFTFKVSSKPFSRANMTPSLESSYIARLQSAYFHNPTERDDLVVHDDGSVAIHVFYPTA